MYDDIIKRHKPKGWTVYYSKRRSQIAAVAKAADEKGKKRDGLIDCAVTDFNTKIIRAPFVTDEYTLHILLHEFAHVKLNHVTWVGKPEPDNLPYHKQEFEADEWAMTIMRLEGVRVTKAIRLSSRRYVTHCIARDLKAGRPIHTHIAKKVKFNLKEH